MIASMDGRNNVDANNSAPNIDDVLDVLKRDELVSQGLMERSHHMVGSILSAAPPNAYIKILEQPAPKALRFRYECEGRSAGSIPGISSTPENKTYPTIQLVGFKGRAVVVVSCVTKDAPHKAHPHNLVGKESCKKGVCTMEVSNDNMMASFANLGIQCVKKKDIEEALRAREKIRVDPYRQGFIHRNQPGSIDLNSVRLCFQAYLEGPERGQFTIPLSPVVSEPIYDKKAMADLVICRLSQCSGSAGGGTDVILLCEKVAKEDINVRFYEEKNGVVVWEALGDFTPTQVHKQVAISFKTPRYKTLQIEEPVKVWIELRRPSDGATSEPRPFTLYPVESGRPPFWSLRKSLFAKAAENNMLSTILEEQKKVQEKNRLSEMVPDKVEVIIPDSEMVVFPQKVIEIAPEDIPECKEEEVSEVVVEVIDVSQDSALEESVMMEEETVSPEQDTKSEGSLHELLEQVKDLEEMFPESETTAGCPELYTSLQMAMKNPMLIVDSTTAYEDVPPPRPTAAKPRPPDPDILPPLPPKRAKKTPAKNLPPIPEKTKLNIFQKLFSSKKKKSKSLQGSIGSKGSTKTINSEILVERGLDLTEAEHYALYTSFAPRATLSECDDMSFYYSPVEGQKVK